LGEIGGNSMKHSHEWWEAVQRLHALGAVSERSLVRELLIDRATLRVRVILEKWPVRREPLLEYYQKMIKYFCMKRHFKKQEETYRLRYSEMKAEFDAQLSYIRTLDND
jgi:hypothetical protein